jgi:hypothetical protein
MGCDLAFTQMGRLSPLHNQRALPDARHVPGTSAMTAPEVRRSAASDDALWASGAGSPSAGHAVIARVLALKSGRVTIKRSYAERHEGYHITGGLEARGGSC